MTGFLEDVLEKSSLDFLKGIEFEERTPGRFFSKQKADMGNGWVQFVVILGPNVSGPVHNHAGEKMDETHILLYGSGKFVVYDDARRPVCEICLERNVPHEIFSTKDCTPDHQYIAGPEGSIVFAREKHY